jgi:hypothetical protein
MMAGTVVSGISVVVRMPLSMDRRMVDAHACNLVLLGVGIEYAKTSYQQ